MRHSLPAAIVAYSGILPAGLAPVVILAADAVILIYEWFVVRTALALPGLGAAGQGHGLALRQDKTVVAWGNNSAGATNVPAGLRGVEAISGGNGYSLGFNGGVITSAGNTINNSIAPRIFYAKFNGANRLLRLEIQTFDQLDPDRPLLGQDLFEEDMILRRRVDAESVEDLLDALALAGLDHHVGKLEHDLLGHRRRSDQADEALDLEGLVVDALLQEGGDVGQLAHARLGRHRDRPAVAALQHRRGNPLGCCGASLSAYQQSRALAQKLRSRVAVALAKPPSVPYAGYAFTPDVVPGAEIELEHLRAPNRCPEGAGMAGVFLWNTPEFRRLDADDESVKQQGSEIVERTFPECRGKVLFVHLVRWNIGIAQFPPGRLREMTALRKRLAAWDFPFDLCGDYLDGLSSEGALRTGEESADRMAVKLAK